MLEKTIIQKIKLVNIEELKKIRCLETSCGEGVFNKHPEITTAYLMCKTPRTKPFPDIHDLITLDDIQTIAEIVCYVDQLQKLNKKGKKNGKG